ncbi:MAG: hypothetical protein COA47_03995 [Robiginitomaculum sp.]|nr:MAG: hypothetical protein COA47_03995 [Robiginitomaculum sp.]
MHSNIESGKSAQFLLKSICHEHKIEASHYRYENTDRDHLSNTPFGSQMHCHATLWSIDMHRDPVSKQFYSGPLLHWAN